MTDPLCGKDLARQLQVYAHPVTGEHWLHVPHATVLGDNGEETQINHTFCKVALMLAKYLKDWANHSSQPQKPPSPSVGPPPGYILPMPILSGSSSLSSQSCSPILSSSQSCPPEVSPPPFGPPLGYIQGSV